jgi:hypothetical protein
MVVVGLVGGAVLPVGREGAYARAGADGAAPGGGAVGATWAGLGGVPRLQRLRLQHGWLGPGRRLAIPRDRCRRRGRAPV